MTRDALKKLASRASNEDGVCVAEIAEQIGLPVNTVHFHMRRRPDAWRFVGRSVIRKRMDGVSYHAPAYCLTETGIEMAKDGTLFGGVK